MIKSATFAVAILLSCCLTACDTSSSTKGEPLYCTKTTTPSNSPASPLSALHGITHSSNLYMISCDDGWYANNGVIKQWNGQQWQERYHEGNGDKCQELCSWPAYTKAGYLNDHSLWLADVLMASDYDQHDVSLAHWDGKQELANVQLSREGPSYQDATPYINGIVSLDDNDVWIVGRWKDCAPCKVPYTEADSQVAPLLQHWDGTKLEAYSVPTGTHNLEAIAMLSKSEGWAVGGLGVILHYTGNRWQEVPSPTHERLEAIDMLSSTDGWIVGKNSVVLHWDGAAWHQMPSLQVTNLEWNSVSVVNSNDVWIAGNIIVDGVVPFNPSYFLGVKIMHWDGKAWLMTYDKPLKPPASGALIGISMVSSDNGWALTDDGNTLHWDGKGWNVAKLREAVR